MTSKTPQFDKALDEYFAKLELDEKGRQWRTCRFNGEKFYVRPEDIEFYKKIRVPLPTLSPVERMRRRVAFAPGYEFFHVTSSYSGKRLITVYPPGSPYKIYEHKIWFSDEWNPLDFRKTVDPKVSFFVQYRELQRSVPRPNLDTDASNINSDYTNSSVHLKDCYLTFDSLYGERLYYFECCLHNKDCVDCWNMINSDTCYKSFGSNLWKCFFCEYSYDCRESYFLYDCKNCANCFMCSNLRNKQYYFLNQPLTKEQYEEKMKCVNLGNYETLQEYRKRFETLKADAVHKPDRNFQSFNSIGDWLENSKDCYYVQYAIETERVSYGIGFARYRDCYDVVGGTDAELCFESLNMSCENNYGIRFSTVSRNSQNIEYCDLMRNCHDCFGCIGLANKSFCIFNNQYTEEEYWLLVDDIKTAMLERGEYGEFFPPNLSPFPYNASIARWYPGFEDFEHAKRYGYRLAEITKEAQEVKSGEVVFSRSLPLDIAEVHDDILEKTIFDEENKKYFRIVPYELSFYRKFNLALPLVHPLVRMHEWRSYFNMRLSFYDRRCPKCGKDIKTTYAPDGPRNVYCESCYLKEVV